MLLLNVAGVLLGILWVLILGRVAMSWIDPRGRTGAARFLVRATEPFLAPVRRRMPSTGMFDLSSLVVLLVLGALCRALLR